jgi:hypothetical protein
MNTVSFPEKTITFTKPKNWDEECVDMDVWENEDKTMKISCWEATPAEVLHFLFFRKIWLRVFLNIQPPVYLSPEFPFNRDINGVEPEPIEKIVEQMIDRKITQFLVAEIDKTDNLQEIYILQSEFLNKLLRDYTKFFAGVEKES